ITTFAEAVPRVNARAEDSSGFVWRFGDERPPAEAAGWPLFDDDRIIASFSIWETPEALKAFVYRGSHGAFYNRRAEWFDQDSPRGYALWWVVPGHRPDITEAWSKVDQMAAEGPSDAVFTFSQLTLAAGPARS
ncbi:DUF3291 domain-containing protein, partial [Ruegeria sp. HKCCA5839]|uniref:DUF3291 domain-containing protein n=1 Tax=Ruegeria sp. HKCCA5839 TaxID=2682981 RepID=UPI00148790F9